MTCEYANYHPTLWRTCRALMNLRRLACLREVIRQPNQTVGSIARNTGLPFNQASTNLRLLQARGLISVLRESRWVYYQPKADPLVEHAETVLKALCKTVSAGKYSDTATLRVLRAFTHPRRLTLLGLLRSQSELTIEQLVVHAHISQPAVWRHLQTLAKSAVVEYVPERQTWRIKSLQTRPPLSHLLLSAI